MQKNYAFPWRLAAATAILALAALGIGTAGCKAKAKHVDRPDGWVGECDPGDQQCLGTISRVCNSLGAWEETQCERACVEGRGCVECVPGHYYCLDNWVMLCLDDETLVQDHECAINEVCILGECVPGCHPDALTTSNVGCEFWAADLDNEAYDMMGGNDACIQQFAVAVANVNDYPVQVTVYRNIARFGEPINEEIVLQRTVNPMDLEQLDLPQREVDGCMGQNGPYVKHSGSGTFVSSHAYRIVSNGPVVAYQFQPIVQQFSNDASILIPTQALGQHHYIMGWATANPCGDTMMPIESIPDHTAITIVGVHENTSVTVNVTHPVMASGGDSGLVIDETPAGGTIQFTVGPYDVVNLESLQFIGSMMDCITALQNGQTGDFTGSLVTSTAPVVVFSNLVRGIGFGDADPTPHPDWDPQDTCCTDHLEEQLFPTTAYGWKHVITRSPVRSTDPQWQEPDIYRVLATVNNTLVTTTLAAPFDQFTLNEGEWFDFWSDRPFIITSDPNQGGAIMVGQILVSQGFIPYGGIGDPTFTIFPAAEQHRDTYVFLIPTTFEDNYMVLALPQTCGIEIDGQPFGEHPPPGCGPLEAIGVLDTVPYNQLICRMDEGVHTVTGNEPFGLTVYGYYNVGSYGYPGGSDVKIINPVR
jgi:hypothetical protein